MAELFTRGPAHDIELYCTFELKFGRVGLLGILIDPSHRQRLMATLSPCIEDSAFYMTVGAIIKVLSQK